MITPILSAEGKMSVLDISEERMASAGADLSSDPTASSNTTTTGMSSSGQETSKSSGKNSKILVIYDTPDRLDQISTLVSELDVMPKQILIQAIIMEVNRDTLKDIGFEWGTGVDGVTAVTPADLPLGSTGTIAGRNIASAGNFTPNAFSPLEGTTNFPGTYPYKAGLEVLLKKIAGTNLEVIIHALE
ncbi:MAG: hypothetical protein NT079_05415 [Candidatus Omnitrophica bacterium]|nr:hypothetical protein [Candidatus Omnitrophota bacterium]